MKRTWHSSVLACVCAGAMVMAPIAARGEEVAGALEPGPEKSAAACQDGADNDEDGKVDCRDSDCHAFAFCAEVSAPPKYWKAPLIAGAILIPVAVILGVGSYPLWNDALDFDHPSTNRHFSGKDGGAIGGAGALTVLSIAAAVAGAVLLTKGINRRQKSMSSARLSPAGVLW